MKLNDEEIFEVFRARARKDYGTDDENVRITMLKSRECSDITDTSSKEYVAWMAGVWKKNSERILNEGN